MTAHGRKEETITPSGDGKEAAASGAERGERRGPHARLRTYFLAGILVMAPISITFWLVWRAVNAVDGWVTPLIPPRWLPETYLPFDIPGFGLILAIVFLTVIGFFAAGYVGRALTRTSEAMVARVPVVRGVYSWTKQVFETVLSQKPTAFNEVVLVEYPSRGVWAIGFITGRTEGEVQGLTRETVDNVFIPATPNPTSGYLLFIPERDIVRLDMTIEEGIKLVISGGIVAPGKKPARAQARPKTPPHDEAPHKHADGLMRRWMRKLRNYFFAGILVTAPLSLTVWIAWEAVDYVDARVMPLIPPRWNPETYLPFSVPGLGLIFAILFLTLIGFFAAGLVGRTLLGFGESLLDRMPVIRGLYSAVKQITETVFKEQSTAFRDVVLIQYPRADSWAIAFLTGDSDATIRKETSDEMVNVFLPTTPNPTSGFLLFMRREEIIPLSMTVEEGIKMVISGGIVTPPAPDELKPAASEKKAPEVAQSA